MGEHSSGPPAPDAGVRGRLDSWKEIAAYLRRDVTTVQRWEKREGMPVHRHVHDKLGSVYAFRAELDAWAGSRNLAAARNGGGSEPLPAPAPPARRRWPVGWASAGAVVVALAGASVWFVARHDTSWRNPLADARFQHVTDFDGIEEAAAISRDGQFVAFISDRDGQKDVWITHVGTGRFYNLTHGRFPELVNASVRTLGFSPDGTLVTFWTRQTGQAGTSRIGVWAVPVLGGDPQPYLDGAAELDWSRDGSRLVYHTTGSGDPTFVKNRGDSAGRPIFAAAAGRHAHFPIWSPDQAFIYFVQGELPGAMDIWRIKASGGAPERITHHNSRVSYPVMVNSRTLDYLATDADGSGPWLYSVDVDTRISHRLSSGLDSYTSLAASADGRRLVLTSASPKGTLWRLRLEGSSADASVGAPLPLMTGRGFAPRFGSGWLSYVSHGDGADAIWKLDGGTATQLWTAPDSRIIEGPEVDADGRRIAFSVERHGGTSLYVMNADGSDARVVTAALDLRGSPAWAPDGRSLTSGALVNGAPHLFRISPDGSAVSLVDDDAIDPVWSRDGALAVYSGPDIGTTFRLKAVASDGRPYPLPKLVLTRGARRVRFFDGRRALVLLRGDLEHKDLWLVDLESGAERQLTHLPPAFNVRDFDISKDGQEVVLERVEQQSDIVLLETGGGPSS